MKDISGPDWFSGIEFGKRRNEIDIDSYTNITKNVRAKIDSFEKKISIIYDKIKIDKTKRFSVKPHVMGNTIKVDGYEAIKYCEEAIRKLRKTKQSSGIIVYVK